MLEVPIGGIIAYGGSFGGLARPDWEKTSGWLVCDGRRFLTATYPDLFKVIRYAWGGGEDRFAIPSLQGMFLRGVQTGEPLASFEGENKDFGGEGEPIRRKDQSKGFIFDPTADSDRVPLFDGGNSEANVGSYQFSATAMPRNKFVNDVEGAHFHSLTLPFETTATRDVADEQSNTVASGTGVFNTTTEPDGTHRHEISGGDRETRPDNANVHWIIRYQ